MSEQAPANQHILDLLGQGFNFHQRNQLEDAALLYRRVLQLDPKNFDALQLLGTLFAGNENYVEAANLLRQAASISNNPYVFNNLGVTLKELADFDGALKSYDRAIQLKPDYAEPHLNKANILKDCGKQDAALESCNQALKLKMNYAEAYFCRGIIYQQLENWNAALNDYNQVIRLQPSCVDAYLNRGGALQELKQLDEALRNYNRGIELQPDYAELHFNRGCVLRDLADPHGAKLALTKALQLQPNHFLARWVLALLPIPLISQMSDDIHENREALNKELLSLYSWLEDSSPHNAHTDVGKVQPFYLAYQEFNNKDLLALQGSICTKLMSGYPRLPKLNASQYRSHNKIKVGIVSHHIHMHSVWDAITKGLILNLDPDKFETYIFYLGNYVDAETLIAQSKATQFFSGAQSLESYVKAISSNEIEVLIYPEIGMHPLTTQLASLRLAPLQLASWGHPETTGLSTIDYYLSAELFEPVDAQLAYSEKLLKLPNLGCTYSKRTVEPNTIDLQSIGIDPSRPKLACPGNLFKYTPQNDWVFAEIATRLRDCQLIFFSKNSSWQRIFSARLNEKFNKYSLRAEDYLVFLPWLPLGDFYGLMKQADVFLDTLGFSGFNTALQSVECTLPIVTRESQFMRGNLASGILKRMEMSEFIAKDDAQYINLVEKLITDKDFSSYTRRLMQDRKDILYSDLEPTRALEKFLINVCRNY